MSFYNVHVCSSIADDEVVDIENTIDCGIQTFNNIIDFYREESNRLDASLWNIFLLLLLLKKSGSHMYPEVSLEEKVFMKCGSFPLKPRSLRSHILPSGVICLLQIDKICCQMLIFMKASLTISYLQVVSYALSRWKKIAIKCYFFFYEGFQADQIVYSFLFLESCLLVGY